MSKRDSTKSGRLWLCMCASCLKAREGRAAMKEALKKMVKADANLQPAARIPRSEATDADTLVDYAAATDAATL